MSGRSGSRGGVKTFLCVAFSLGAAFLWMFVTGTRYRPPAAANAEASTGTGVPSPATVPAAAKTPGSVSARVTLPDGSPCPDAVVWIGRNAVPDPGGAIALADEEGRFRLEVPSGTCVLSARAPGRATATTPILVVPERAEVEGGTLVLEDGGVIEGRVTDSAGRGIPGVSVVARTEDGIAVEMAVAGRRLLIGSARGLSGADGRFRLSGLGEGGHEVRCDLEAFSGWTARPVVASGVEAGGGGAEFVLAGSLTVAGTVLDSTTGHPVDGAVVAGVYTTSADGRFEVAVPLESRPRVESAGHVSRELPGAPWLPWQRRGDLEVRVAPRPESGALHLDVSSFGGADIGEFEVLLTGNDFRTWRRRWSSTSADRTWSPVAAGPYRLVVEAPGHVPFGTTVEVVAGETRVVPATLAAAGSVRLRILDATGAVRTDVEDLLLHTVEGDGPAIRWIVEGEVTAPGDVRAQMFLGGPHGTKLAVSRPDGRLVGVPPGRYELVARCGADRLEATFEVEAGATVEVTLGPGSPSR